MAHSEVEEREQKLQHAEDLNNSIRLELLSSDTERRQLRDSVNNKEREIQQVTGAKAIFNGKQLAVSESQSVCSLSEAHTGPAGV